MKNVLIACSVLSVFAVCPANAEFYGAVGLGSTLKSNVTVDVPSYMKLDMETDPGIAASLAVGYQLPVWKIRAEIEGLYINGNVKNHPLSDALQLRTQGAMANAYIPIPIPFVQLYAGAGIGMTQTTGWDKNADIGNSADFEIAYQAIVGIELELPVVKAIGIEARYLRTTANFPGGVSVDADNWLLMLRARF